MNTPGTVDTTSQQQATALIAIASGLAQELGLERRQTRTDPLDQTLGRDWGFDSLSRAELLLRVERGFDVRLPRDLLQEAETLADILRTLLRLGPSQAPETPPHAVAPEPLAAAEPAPRDLATLTDVLAWHAEHHPDRTHLTLFLDDDEEVALSYRDLLTRSQRVAPGLLANGVEPGDRVAIMLPTSLDFFVAFFGALCAGAVPVPIYPPARPSQLAEHLLRQAGILRNAGATWLITTAAFREASTLLRMQVSSMLGVSTVTELEREAPVGRIQASGDDVALLQYTSGSTGDPKGVVLSHANVLANVRAMGEAMRVTPQDVFVSWLPLYHDMGLIGAWLGSLYFAVLLVVMPPLAFLVRPQRWLWAIHRHRGTLSAAPNFAFDLCQSRIGDAALEGLDLSSLRMVANGSEAVSPDTLRRFIARFEPYGFRPEAMAPVYGLAENAVGLAFPPLGRAPLIDRVSRTALRVRGRAEPAAQDDADALELVACGQPLRGHEIRILGPGGECGEREEGQLQFRGPSSTRGYFAEPGKTADLIRNGWLNSGDLAYLAGGDVFITGRIKDIIIRAGRHIYPEEIERVVGSIPGIRKGWVAVFGVRDPRAGTERVVIAAETRFTDPHRLASLRQNVVDAATPLLDGAPDEVALVPPRGIPKTSSGKLRRTAARQLFEQDRLGRGAPSRRHQMLQLLAAGVLPQARRAVGSAGMAAYAAWWWLVVILCGGVAWPLVALAPNPIVAWRVTRTAARIALRLLAIRPEIVGSGTSAMAPILTVTHASYFDALVLAALLPGRPSFVAKQELNRQWIAGTFLRALGTLFVDRTDPEGGVTDTGAAEAAAAQGRTLVFFPEGTFIRSPGLLPFRLGAFLIAARRGLPVLPMALRGTRSVLRASGWWPRRHPVSVWIGTPVMPDGNDFAAAVRLRETVRSAILAHCGEPDAGTS